VKLLRRVSQIIGWPRAYRAIVMGRLTLRHYRDAVLGTHPLTSPIAGLRRYARDRRAYLALPGAERLTRYDDNPQLFDWLPTTPYDPHYLHQDAWAARELHARGVEEHVDVGSRITFVAGIAAFTRVTFVDIRPLDTEVPGLTSVAGSVLSLPFSDGSLGSLSCLHVAEHIGLGRYGDPLDPAGTRKAALELARVLAPGGTLLFALPVGEPRTNFNAHRVHDPREVPGLFPGLRLDAFAAVDDAGCFRPDARPDDLAGASWSCGMYRLVRDR
jgi:SAM-dependent methyltransferase